MGVPADPALDRNLVVQGPHQADAYVRPLLVLCCLTARDCLRRTEQHGLRAALRRRCDTPLQLLYPGRLVMLDTFLRAAAIRCLLRTAETRNVRLLSSFCSLARQSALEQLDAVLDAEERQVVRTALADLGIRTGALNSDRTSPNRRVDVNLWGVSSFS